MALLVVSMAERVVLEELEPALPVVRGAPGVEEESVLAQPPVAAVEPGLSVQEAVVVRPVPVEAVAEEPASPAVEVVPEEPVPAREAAPVARLVARPVPLLP